MVYPNEPYDLVLWNVSTSLLLPSNNLHIKTPWKTYLPRTYRRRAQTHRFPPLPCFGPSTLPCISPSFSLVLRRGTPLEHPPLSHPIPLDTPPRASSLLTTTRTQKPLGHQPSTKKKKKFSTISIKKIL